MSSSSHQNYTRIWTNELNIPIFSVDYRLSPASKFPDALNDVWQVYLWILEYGELILKIKINEVILAGDSAGGNLCAALTILCIQKGYKIPHSIVMSYPAPYVGQDLFVPSILLSLDDVLLNSKFLRFALEAYAKDLNLLNPSCHPDLNPLISPLVASPEILSKFPPCLMQVCQNDPLRDYGALFAIKLKKAGVNI